MNPPIPPAEIVLEDYLNPMGISQNAMARAIGVPPRAINEIVLGKRDMRFDILFRSSQACRYVTFNHLRNCRHDSRRRAGCRRHRSAGIAG